MSWDGGRGGLPARRRIWVRDRWHGLEALEPRMMLSGAPVGTDDFLTVTEDGEIFNDNAATGVLANDSHPDGKGFYAQVLDGPDHGLLHFYHDGRVRYYPDNNFNGVDTFTYVLREAFTVDPSRSTVQFEGVLQAPGVTSVADSITTSVSGAIHVDLNPAAPPFTSGWLRMVNLTMHEAVSWHYDIPGGTIDVTVPEGGVRVNMLQGGTGPTPMTFGGVLGSPTLVMAHYGTFTYASTGAGEAIIPSGLRSREMHTGMSLSIQIAVVGDQLELTIPLTFFPSVQCFTDYCDTKIQQNTTGTIVATRPQLPGDPSQPVTVTIEVTPVDDPIVARDDTYAVDEDGQLVSPASLFANDETVDGEVLTAELVEAPLHGQLELHEDGTFTYTPAPDYFGPDEFRYRAVSGDESSEATVRITVRPTPDTSTANDDYYAVAPGGMLMVDAGDGLLSNDADPDAGPLRSVVLTPPQFGTLLQSAADGSFTYVPGDDFTGFDQFEYGVFDLSDPSLATIDAPLVPRNSVWRYLDDGTDQGTGWREPGFDDAAWPSGPGKLGYGEGDESTYLSFGPDQSNKYPTYYFRHRFHVDDPRLIVSLIASMRIDDGAAAYLNGVEIARYNLAENAGFNDLAMLPAPDDGRIYLDFIADASLLVPGENLLAVEVHQQSRVSADMSFDLSLTARTARLDAPAATATAFITVAQRGDVNADGLINDGDIDDLYGSLGSTDPRFDVDGSGGPADTDDINHLVRNLLNTEFGDLDLDGDVDITDLSGLATWFGTAGGGWARGNINGQAGVTIGDLSLLAAHFGFQRGGNGGGASADAADVLDEAARRTDGVIVVPTRGAKPDATQPAMWRHVASVLDDEASA